MSANRTKVNHICLTFILMTSVFALFSGCNSASYPDAKSPISNSINEIIVSEEEKSWDCVVSGNSPLSFSAINHINPAGILIYFPDTTLDIPDMDRQLLPNDIIGFIETDEFIDGENKNSRILIGLKRDRPYSISPHPKGLKISFPKTLDKPMENGELLLPAEHRTVVSGEPDFPAARLLKTVTATPLPDNIIVNVHADGVIMDYKSFAIEDPARIVFDIYNIKGSGMGQKTMAVNSHRVKQIRYNQYPNKIRLVLDTEQRFLAQYFSFPTATGLLIYVGQIPEPLKKIKKSRQ